MLRHQELQEAEQSHALQGNTLRAPSPGQGQLDSHSELLPFPSRHAIELAQSQVLQSIVISEWLLFPEFAKARMGKQKTGGKKAKRERKKEKTLNLLFALQFALFYLETPTRQRWNINNAQEHTACL